MTSAQLLELQKLEAQLKALKAKAGIHEYRQVQVRNVNNTLYVPTGITGEKLTKILKS